MWTLASNLRQQQLRGHSSKGALDAGGTGVWVGGEEKNPVAATGCIVSVVLD